MTESSRVRWPEVPAHVRRAVDDLLRSPVVHATSQSGGFSPGSADRVVCADGRRAFVKTATSDVNPEVVPIHRREAAVAAVLPSVVPAPRFIGSVGGAAADGRADWVALAFEEVDGRHPALPWRPDELDAALGALAATAAATLDEAARAVIPSGEERMADIAQGWTRLLAEPSPGVDTTDPDVAWAVARAERWAQDVPTVIAETRGDALVHFDARDDNLLVRADGSVVLVDWPWAVRGTAWFDALLLLLSARHHDPGADVGAVIETHRAFERMDAPAATRVIAAFAGYLLDRGRLPDPPGLPTLRAFQRDQGTAAARLLRERLD